MYAIGSTCNDISHPSVTDRRHRCVFDPHLSSLSMACLLPLRVIGPLELWRVANSFFPMLPIPPPLARNFPFAFCFSPFPFGVCPFVPSRRRHRRHTFLLLSTFSFHLHLHHHFLPSANTTTYTPGHVVRTRPCQLHLSFLFHSSFFFPCGSHQACAPRFPAVGLPLLSSLSSPRRRIRWPSAGPAAASVPLVRGRSSLRASARASRLFSFVDLGLVLSSASSSSAGPGGRPAL